jgi:hypothetical protein
MNGALRALTQEKLVTIRDLQKNPSAYLKGIVRIMKRGKTVGFFFSDEEVKKLFGLRSQETPSFEAIQAAYERGDIIDDESDEGDD